MPEEKTCAYKSELTDYKCKRPAWKSGGKKEKYCLFHSEQDEKKKEEFKREIDLFKEGNPTEYLLGGKRGELEFYDFRGFRFPEGCSEFEEHEFIKSVDFDEATFSGYAGFDGATFSGYAGFHGATFSGDAGFHGATFSGDAWFRGATFSGYARFHGATFNGDASFIDVISKNARLYFRGSVLKKNLFVKTSPTKETQPASLILDNARVIGNLSIYDSKLCRILASNLTYRRVLTLRNVIFDNEDFKAPSTLENVYLERAKFTNIDLSTVALGGPFLREVAFDRIKFGSPSKPGWFCSSFLLGRPNEAIYEERYARYGHKSDKNEESDSGEKVDKHGFIKKIRLSFGRFRNRFGFQRIRSFFRNAGKRKDDFGAAETVYRTLKHEMEKQHAKGLARRMRAGELECILHGEANPFQRVFLFGYRFLNGFGLRWIRALVFWLACILSFAFIYNGRPAYFDCYRETVRIEDGNIVRESGVVPIDITLDFGDALLHSLQMTSVVMRPTKIIISPDIGWIEFFEKILSPALLFLFLQAARNAARD